MPKADFQGAALIGYRLTNRLNSAVVGYKASLSVSGLDVREILLS